MVDKIYHAVVFLSTPSARRATRDQRRHCKGWRISIHALREEGDAGHVGDTGQINDFYPRPPRGGRHRFRRGSGSNSKFLSTPSARRATQRFKTQ